MSKFSFVINDDCTATASLGDEELADVRRIMIFGEPLHYVVSIEQCERNENKCYFNDENGHLVTKTHMIEICPQKEVDE